MKLVIAELNDKFEISVIHDNGNRLDCFTLNTEAEKNAFVAGFSASNRFHKMFPVSNKPERQ